MTYKFGLIAGVALAALTQSPLMAGEPGVSPKLSIVSVDPASPLISASRGIQIPDTQTTSSIEPGNTQLALAVQSDDESAARQDVDLSLATGPEEASPAADVVLASMAPLPTKRPVVAGATVKHDAVVPVRTVSKRAKVELVSDVEQPRKKRVFRYPGPVLVGVYN